MFFISSWIFKQSDHITVGSGTWIFNQSDYINQWFWYLVWCHYSPWTIAWNLCFWWLKPWSPKGLPAVLYFIFTWMFWFGGLPLLLRYLSKMVNKIMYFANLALRGKKSQHQFLYISISNVLLRLSFHMQSTWTDPLFCFVSFPNTWFELHFVSFFVLPGHRCL